MPRAEHSTDLGEIFRVRCVNILRCLGYDVIGTKFAIRCKLGEFHNVQEHTIDILGSHVHRFESLPKKPIVVESKKTLSTSLQSIENIVVDPANKIDCLGKSYGYLGTDEGLILSDSNPRLATHERFGDMSRLIQANRSVFISLVAGPMLRIVEAISGCLNSYSQTLSTSITLPLKSVQADIGTPCPMNLGARKVYLCGVRVGDFRISIFKTLGENYSSTELVDDLAWVNKHNAILDAIHSSTGYVYTVVCDIESTGLGTALIDHYLQRTFFGDYQGYTRIG